ncbi:MAG: radical SAM protein [Acidobacteriota bacterium]
MSNETSTPTLPVVTSAPEAAASTPREKAVPRVRLRSLDTLWFQVGGTLCNLACSHCFVSCSPTNHTHEFLSLDTVRQSLDEALELGVKEYYFTGGEPFLNPDMEAILEVTLRQGPASVLTNGLLLDAARCRRLATLSESSDYSLDLRISLDGYDAESNDPIRGEGTFERILAGARTAHDAGLNPVMTVTEVHASNASARGRERFLDLLRAHGFERPRLKVLPVFQIGNEAERTGAYASWQRLLDDDAPPDGWDHLQCSTSRMVTDQGVWVCPILVNEPGGRMGQSLADSLESFPLGHSACWTCHVHGVSCRT